MKWGVIVVFAGCEITMLLFLQGFAIRMKRCNEVYFAAGWNFIDIYAPTHYSITLTYSALFRQNKVTTHTLCVPQALRECCYLCRCFIS